MPGLDPAVSPLVFELLELVMFRLTADRFGGCLELLNQTQFAKYDLVLCVRDQAWRREGIL